MKKHTITTTPEQAEELLLKDPDYVKKNRLNGDILMDVLAIAISMKRDDEHIINIAKHIPEKLKKDEYIDLIHDAMNESCQAVKYVPVFPKKTRNETRRELFRNVLLHTEWESIDLDTAKDIVGKIPHEIMNLENYHQIAAACKSSIEVLLPSDVPPIAYFRAEIKNNPEGLKYAPEENRDQITDDQITDDLITDDDIDLS